MGCNDRPTPRARALRSQTLPAPAKWGRATSQSTATPLGVAVPSKLEVVHALKSDQPCRRPVTAQHAGTAHDEMGHSLSTTDTYAWRKSQRSAHNDACVEVAPLPTKTGIRDSQDPTRGYLTVGPAAWTDLVRALKG
ncbi:DUF397 domain-containing protein [Embleya sp. NPDC008237]|uniref:DUF397 domain-containing protein n=1 Tax=Embleya sp. NPDC008237 TaxID=3363978 RepID=UPI0036E987B6